MSNFALALHPALSPPHTQTHTHISCLALSFPLRHLTIAATTAVSHSLFVVTRSFHPRAFLAVCSPSDTSVSHSVHCFLSSLSLRLWPGKVRVCPIVRNDCQMLKFVNQPATLSRPTSVLPLLLPKHPTPLWAHVWVCGCYTVLIKRSNLWIMFPTVQHETKHQNKKQELCSISSLQHSELYLFQMRGTDCGINHTLTPAHMHTHTLIILAHDPSIHPSIHPHSKQCHEGKRRNLICVSVSVSVRSHEYMRVCVCVFMCSRLLSAIPGWHHSTICLSVGLC